MPVSAQQLAHRLTFRQLQVFMAVYQMRNYSRVGEHLGLTQPAVSSQIRQLEQALGTPLFEYSGRRLFSTAAAEHLVKSASSIFGELDVLQTEIAALQGRVAGELRLVAVNTAQYVLPYMLRAFIIMYPQIRLSVRVVNRATAITHLLSNRDDLALMGLVPPDKPLTSLPFLDNELIPVVPPEHPLLKQTNISAQTFLDSQLITREEGSGSRLSLELHCESHRLQLQPNLVLGSNELVKHAVMAGLGVAVLSQASILSELQTGVLCPVRVQGFPLRRSWCLTYASEKQPSPPMRAFIDYVQQNIRTFEQRLGRKVRALEQPFNGQDR